jgi:hypothetical protein
MDGLGTMRQEVRRWAWPRWASLDPFIRNPLWQRARRAPVYDREGYIGRVQRGGCLIALAGLVVTMLFFARDLRDSGCSIAFAIPTWIGIALLVVVVAGASLVGERRRGFLELMLVTPLTGEQVVDGTALAVWEHLRRVYWLPWVLGGFFVLTGASLPHGVAGSLLTATLFGVLMVYHGIACSLAARSLAGALVSTLLLPLVAIPGLFFLVGMFRHGSGPLLWFGCLFLWPACYFWTRRRLTPASVGCFLTVTHLVFAALASFWTIGNREEYPVAAMHPAFITIITLDKRPHQWFEGLSAWWVLQCYWAALVVNIVWLRWWTIRHFDRMTERTPPRIELPIARARLVERRPEAAAVTSIQAARDG